MATTSAADAVGAPQERPTPTSDATGASAPPPVRECDEPGEAPRKRARRERRGDPRQ